MTAFSDTQPPQFHQELPARAKRVNFDWTINLGHILTATSFLLAGLMAYTVIEKRVSLLEEKSEVAARLATDRVVEQKETLKEIRTDIKDMSRAVRDVERAISANTVTKPNR